MKAHNATKLIRILEEFQKLNQNMNLRMAQTILEVGKGGGVTGRDIEAALGVSSSVASRNLVRLENVNGGWNLVRTERDADGKSNIRYPNAEMTKFLAKVEHILDGE